MEARRDPSNRGASIEGRSGQNSGLGGSYRCFKCTGSPWSGGNCLGRSQCFAIEVCCHFEDTAGCCASATRRARSPSPCACSRRRSKRPTLSRQPWIDANVWEFLAAELRVSGRQVVDNADFWDAQGRTSPPVSSTRPATRRSRAGVPIFARARRAVTGHRLPFGGAAPKEAHDGPHNRVLRRGRGFPAAERSRARLLSHFASTRRSDRTASRPQCRWDFIAARLRPSA